MSIGCKEMIQIYVRKLQRKQCETRTTGGINYMSRLQIRAKTSTSRTQIAVSSNKGGLEILLGLDVRTALVDAWVLELGWSTAAGAASTGGEDSASCSGGTCSTEGSTTGSSTAGASSTTGSWVEDEDGVGSGRHSRFVCLQCGQCQFRDLHRISFMRTNNGE